MSSPRAVVPNSAVIGYQSPMPSAQARAAFNHDHPVVEDNVFLIMRFEPRPVRRRIHALITDVTTELGLHLVRADDRDYSGELWTNVKLCLDHSRLAIAVIDAEGTDAENMAVEIGYLLARETPLLILRDIALGPPPAMLAHRLHTPFDKLDLEGTLAVAVRHWLSMHPGRSVA